VLGALGLRAYRAGLGLPESRLLDRLLRGRAWIALLAALLIGLVALNVSLLKLNRQAGRDADVAKALHVRNTQLQTQVSRLASSGRLQREGHRLGLVTPAAAEVHYVVARGGDARRAGRELRSQAPAPSGMLGAVTGEDPGPAPSAPAAAPVPSPGGGTTAPTGAPVGTAPSSPTPARTTAPQAPAGAGQGPATAAPAPGGGAGTGTAQPSPLTGGAGG
jgi:hypothetical protein